MVDIKGAVFLDRDGVVIEQVHHLHRPEDVRLIPKVAEAINLLNKKSIDVIVVTNQSVVARGMCTEKDVGDVHEKISAMLEEKDANIDAFYICPHHPVHGLGGYKVDCDCRKPKPGMLYRASEDRGIDLSKSFLIGDKTSDLLAGKKAGCVSIGVKTGYGCDDGIYEVKSDFMADDLYEAVKIILERWEE